MRRNDFLVGCLVALLSAPLSPASAYQEAGHFFTAYTLARSFGARALAPSEEQLLAFCAQLPDQSSDLDAVAVYAAVAKHPIDWLRWAASDYVGSVEIRRMVTVQQLLHALTGGDAGAARALGQRIAARIAAGSGAARDRPAAVCALGFALHFVGDSYAHRRMGEDAAKMYPTGRGHAVDFSYPDYPLCDAFADDIHVASTCRRVVGTGCTSPDAAASRFCAWRGYPEQVAAAFSLLGGAAEPAAREMAVATAHFQPLASSASDSNDWNERASEDAIGTALGFQDGALQAFIAAHRSREPCQAVLDAAVKAAIVAPNTTADPAGPRRLSCMAAWNVFVDIALDAFASLEHEGQQVRKPKSGGAWEPVYACPLTDRAYNSRAGALCTPSP